MADARHELLVRAAWLYYDRRLTQQEVSRRLGISRSSVSRALTQAEAEGIVRIELRESPPRSVELAEELVARFSLTSAHVSIPLPGESPRETAATAMARRFETLCANGATTVATGWGRTLARAAQLTRVRPAGRVTFVDSIGHATTDEIAPAVEVSSRLARSFGAKVVHMPSPAFAPSAAAASFRDTPEVRRALDLARSADASVVSVGVIGPESLLLREQILPAATMDQLVREGAVGELLGHYYDARGGHVSVATHDTIGLSLADLRDGRLSIACAGGADKATALHGAISGGFVDEVVVDDTLATALLAQPPPRPRGTR